MAPDGLPTATPPVVRQPAADVASLNDRRQNGADAVAYGGADAVAYGGAALLNVRRQNGADVVAEM